MHASTEDAEMNDDTEGASKQPEGQSQPRKIVKAKRKARPEEKLVDEDGNEISFEDDSDELEEHEYIDDQVVEG